MSIITPNFNVPYAFTYKLNTRKAEPATKEDYQEILSHINKLIPGGLHCVYYELDSNQSYHIHGIIYAPQYTIPSYRKLSVKGYTSRWRQIYDYAGWESYIKKDQDDDSIDVPDDSKLVLKRSLFK